MSEREAIERVEPAGGAELEHVARAIAEAEGQIGSPLGYFPQGTPMRAATWEDHTDETHATWLKMAKAAIAAWNTRAGAPSPDMAELQRLSEDATLGPWRADNDDGYGRESIYGPRPPHDLIAQCVGDDAETCADAAFIVACVNYVRAQLTSPSRPDARLREAVERLRVELEHFAATEDHIEGAGAYSHAASCLQHLLAQTGEGD